MKKRNTLGFILILLGVVFLLDTLGYLEFGLMFDKYWPMALIILGIVNLFRERSGKVFSLLLILVGSFLQLDRLDIFLIDIWDLFVPALLIVGGLGIIINRDDNKNYEENFSEYDTGQREQYKAKETYSKVENEEDIIDEEIIIEENNNFNREDKKDPYEEENNSFSNDISYDDYIDLSCAFTERKVSNRSENFKGGKVSSVIATTIVDLRDADFYENKAMIDINSILGNVEILVPKNCRVEISGTPILGGWNNYSRVDRENEKLVLRVRALIILGGVDIR